MTMPDSDGLVAALLANISKDVSDTRTDVAVIKEQVSKVPQLEERIRLNESAIVELRTAAGTNKDWAARLVAAVAVLAAVGSGVAAWVAAIHH